MTTVLDVANFNLKAAQTAADIRVKLLQAYADYDLKMMEVLLKRIEAERQMFKLAVLKDQYASFKRAQLEAARRLREAQRDRNHVIQHAGYVAKLKNPSGIAPGEVVKVWASFRYFIPKAANAEEILNTPISSSDRPGRNFYYNRQPDRTCEDAPENVQFVGELAEWLRRKNYLPRHGTLMYSQMAKAVNAIAEAAKAHADELESSRKQAAADLERIRAMGWAKVDLTSEKPKA